MRSITRCPACQTQFFVSEVQLNKHDGKVRCGQCLHVFNAKMQFVAIETPEAETTAVETAAIDTSPILVPGEIPAESPAVVTTSTETAPTDADLAPDLAQIIIPENIELNNVTATQTNNQTTAEWPSIDDDIFDENDLLNTTTLDLSSLSHAPLEQEPFAEEVELSASPEDIQAFAAESTATPYDDNDTIIIDDDDFNEVTESQFDAAQIKNLNDITKLTIIADNQTIAGKPANYFDDLAGKNKLSTKNPIKKSHRGLWLVGAFILLITAAAQSIYFLRDDIAIYYPNLKPMLIKACQLLACSVNLPKQIDLIVIDDSDMQEDKNIEGVMHLSSSLINKAGFNLAYPNLELTLTDVDDNPMLRRVFKPIEYLPATTNIALGLRAAEEIKIKLAITTPGETVAGYRIFVTY